MFSTIGNHNLIRRVIKVVALLELFAYRFLKLYGTRSRCIFCEAVIKGFLSSVFDVCGCIKIWLACAETYDINTLSLHCLISLLTTLWSSESL